MLLVKGGCLVGQYLILNRVLFNQTLGALLILTTLTLTLLFIRLTGTLD